LVVERAIVLGDLREDTDADIVVDACVAPVFYRFLITGAPLDSAFVDDLITSVIRGFAPDRRS
jgi:hypothetical protein